MSAEVLRSSELASQFEELFESRRKAVQELDAARSEKIAQDLALADFINESAGTLFDIRGIASTVTLALDGSQGEKYYRTVSVGQLHEEKNPSTFEGWHIEALCDERYKVTLKISRPEGNGSYYTMGLDNL